MYAFDSVVETDYTVESLAEYQLVVTDLNQMTVANLQSEIYTVTNVIINAQELLVSIPGDLIEYDALY